MSNWDQHFMNMARLVADKSKDRSTKVGCVIATQDNAVVSTGYNGFPRGCFDDASAVERHFDTRYFGQDSSHLGRTDQELDEMAVLQISVESRHDRPAKYKWTEHAERNAIYSVARNGGTKLRGCKIYVPWFPCVDCARAIIQSGISAVYAYEPDFNDPRWGADFKIAVEMFEEAGVVTVYVQKDQAGSS